MKHIFFKVLFTLGIIVSSLAINSQETVTEKEKKNIQRQSRFIRKKFTKQPSILAAKLTKDLDDDASRVIAITYWITKNIKYDFSAYISNTMNRHNSREVLRRKIALCDEYANLFNDMCESVGIQSERINGYVHEFDFFGGDTLYRAQHAWSIVNIDENWELMDLTWGSGHLEPKKQFVKNLMWMLFEKPYKVEWHYVHAYDPDWFYVRADKMITSHFPTLDFFQFLDNPFTIEKFNDFSSSGLSKPVVKTTPELKAYLSMGDMSKLDLEITHTQRINPNNNRLLGFNNYLIFKNFYLNKYDEDEKEIVASDDEIKNIKSIHDKANENLLQSIKNNNLEYKHYHTRSVDWKDSLESCNNTYIKQVKLRVKLNKTQLKSIKKIDKKSNAYAKSANKSKDRFKRFKIDRIKRPNFDKSNPSLAKNCLSEKDSLLCDLFVFNYLTDSLFSKYDKLEQYRMSSSEAFVTKTHQKNALMIKKHNFKKMRDYAFIYLDDNLVDKPWFPVNFAAANNQNLADLDVLLNDLSCFLPQLKISVKADYNHTKYALKAIKLAKKNSFNDLNEKYQADEIIADYQVRMKQYADDFSNYSQVSAKVSFLLNRSQKKLKSTYKSFKKDLVLEKQRHKNYMAYRESIRYSENFNMKLLIKELKGWNKGFKEEPVLVRKPTQTQQIVENNDGEEVEKLSYSLSTNAVLVVGTHLGSNDNTAANMDKIGDFLKSKGVRVHKFYNQQSDWELIKEASQNAHFFIYSGHGSNMGKNGTGGLVLKDWISNDQIQNELKLKDNALVLFKSVCGGAGSSAGDNGDIGYKEAELRVSDYAEPFLNIGASTYYANNYGDGCISFLEDFFDGNSIKECYDNSLLWGVNKHISKNYMYETNLKIAISGSNANSGTHTIISTDSNGVEKSREVPNSKSYSISYVGNPYFDIGDIYKKKYSYVMN